MKDGSWQDIKSQDNNNINSIINGKRTRKTYSITNLFNKNIIAFFYTTASVSSSVVSSSSSFADDC